VTSDGDLRRVLRLEFSGATRRDHQSFMQIELLPALYFTPIHSSAAFSVLLSHHLSSTTTEYPRLLFLPPLSILLATSYLYTPLTTMSEESLKHLILLTQYGIIHAQRTSSFRSRRVFVSNSVAAGLAPPSIAGASGHMCTFVLSREQALGDTTANSRLLLHFAQVLSDVRMVHNKTHDLSRSPNRLLSPPS